MPKRATLDEFWNDVKHGVYNFTKDGKCVSCGNCCTAILPVTKEELKAIKRYIKRKHIKPVVHPRKADIDLTCPFRNDAEKKCNIYEVRPTICRDFKCDKPHKLIDETKEKYNYDNRFHAVNMRSIF